MIYCLLPVIIIYVALISLHLSYKVDETWNAKLAFYIVAGVVSLVLSFLFYNYFKGILLNWIVNIPISVIMLSIFVGTYDKNNR
jgi:hypothetical protein